MLIFNYAEWTFWESFNPPNTVGPQKVTFDGPNKLILINFGETNIDLRIDVYSNWKEWVLQRDNSKFQKALSVVGGDPLPGAKALGTTFFLENGWKFRTWEGEHILTMTGNIFSRDGTDPFVPTLGNFRITVNLNTSDLVETLETGSLLGINSVTQVDELWKLEGLDKVNPMTVTQTSRTAGPISQTFTGDVTTQTVQRT